MKEELYIYTPDGAREKLDLPSPSGITLKWVNNLFSDISKLTCSHSYTFKLPMTQNNVRLLDMANDIRHHSKMIRIRVDADFYINGVCLCPNANLYVSEVGDTTFSCVMTWRVLKAFETLKGSSLKLNELPSVGTFTWKDDDSELQYGKPTGKWGNDANILLRQMFYGYKLFNAPNSYFFDSGPRELFVSISILLPVIGIGIYPDFVFALSVDKVEAIISNFFL